MMAAAPVAFGLLGLGVLLALSRSDDATPAPTTPAPGGGPLPPPPGPSSPGVPATPGGPNVPPLGGPAVPAGPLGPGGEVGPGHPPVITPGEVLPPAPGGLGVLDVPGVQRPELGARSFLANLPQRSGPDRDAALLAAVRARFIKPPNWIPVDLAPWNGHTGRIFVADDAVQIGSPGDWVRISTSHPIADLIAESLGAVLPTPYLADLIWVAAQLPLEPSIQVPKDQSPEAHAEWNKTLGSTPRMVQHSDAVDAKIAGRTGLVANAGKLWTTTERLKGKPAKSANYGWFDKNGKSKSVTGFALHQPLGTAHDASWVDYSQTIGDLIWATMIADGEPVAVRDVMSSPTLFGLVSREGPMSVLRHPANAGQSNV